MRWLAVMLTCVTCVVAADVAVAEASDPVVMRVDGHAILASGITCGLPADLTGPFVVQARRDRAARVVELTALRLYLERRKAVADEAEVEAAYRTAIDQPSSALACACCTTGSFDHFLAMQYLTRDDFRTSVAIELGLTILADHILEEQYPGQGGRAALVAKLGPALREQYRRWHRLTFVDGNDETAAHQAAADACRRLRAGLSWGAIAAERGERSLFESRNGGYLGIRRIGDAVPFQVDRTAVAALAAGNVSDPLRGFNCWCVMQWDHLSDEDVYVQVRQSHQVRTRQLALEECERLRRVEYIDEGLRPVR